MNPAVLLFLRANWRYLGAMLVAGTLVNLIVLALPLFSSLVYDKAIGNRVHDTLWALTIGMLVMLVLEVALRLVRVQVVEHAGAHWDHFLDERLMRGVLTAPLTRPLPVAQVLNGLREVGAAREVLSAQFLLPLADFPFLLLFVAAVALIGGPIVLVPIGFGLLVAGVSAVSQRLAARRYRFANARTGERLAVLVDVLSAREGGFGPATAAKVQQRFRAQSQQAGRASARGRWWMQVGQQVVPVLMSASTVAVLVAGVYRIEAQQMSVGGLISVSLISGRILNILCGLAPFRARWGEFRRAIAGLSDTVALDAPPMAPPSADEGRPADALQAEGIRLDEVSFAYPGRERAALDRLTLQLRVGELVAVIGTSGTGKSTLLRLLAGRVPSARGRMAVGGHLVADDASRTWLNRQVTFKSQDPAFLGGTVRDVVAGDDVGATDASVVAALRQAGMGPALDRGDVGLNSIVGTNGLGLSGGQRQMLAMAAVFHGGRPIALLDEPTLGLDRAAQDSVVGALRGFARTRCVVVATHATEVIAEADRVLVLDGGRIVADAPPRQLIPGLSTRTAPAREHPPAGSPRASAGQVSDGAHPEDPVAVTA